MTANRNQVARRRTMAAVLAGAAMGGFLLVGLLLFFQPVPVANKDYFQTFLIALVGAMCAGTGYYLGSSDGSAAKNDTWAANLTAQPSATEPPVPELGDA